MPASSKPVVFRVGIGFHNDVVALTNADMEAACFVGLDGNEIIGHNGEAVAVNGELEMTIRCGIDKTRDTGISRANPGG